MRRSDRIFRVATTFAIAVTAAALVVGCTVSGDPLPEGIDPAVLDVGAYNAYPLDVPVGENVQYGRILESMRMIEALVDPVDVDSGLANPVGSGSVTVLPTPTKVTSLLAEPVRDVLERNGMSAGAAVAGTDYKSADGNAPEVGAARVLAVIVLRFPDSEAARRAARDMDAADAAVNPENVPIAIPEYSAAHGHWRPTVSTIAATLAHDSYVVSLLIGHTTPDLAAMTALARKAFDRQLPRLREFAATASDQIASLPLDPDGMLRRLVPAAPGRWPYPAVVSPSGHRAAGWDFTLWPTGVVYGSRGARLFIGKPQSAVESMAVNGFDALARYSNPAAARQSFNGANKADADARALAIPPPSDLRDVTCSESGTPDTLKIGRYICRILYGRYLVTISGREWSSLRQRAAAQYSLLVNGG